MNARPDVRALRLQLCAAGFCPIPLFGKEPPVYGKNNKRKGLSGWQDLRDITTEQIDMWAKTWPDATNTGALTRLMPTLDLDLLNEDAVRTIEDHVRERFEERGYVLTRVGLPPKRCIVFRTNDPFPKIVANVIAPNGSEEKIELLADGQQVVVDGIHPQTGQAYRWFGGQPGPIKLEELAYISTDEARVLVDESVELLIREFGYMRTAERPKNRSKSNGADSETHQGEEDWSYLFNNIRNGHSLHDALRDLAAKLVKSGTNSGAINSAR
jgi:hypothetical protein